MRHVSYLFGLVLCGCAGFFPTVVPEAKDTEFKATGEVQSYNRSCSFDAVRVRSPVMNLAKRTDGSWAGTFSESPINVSVTNDVISGVDVRVTREMSEGNRLVITGQFQGRIYRFEFDQNQALIRAPSRSQTFIGRQASEGVTTYGPMGNLIMRGEAGIENPPWPQIAFAMMAIMH